jgi:hypothetical protein
MLQWALSPSLIIRHKLTGRRMDQFLPGFGSNVSFLEERLVLFVPINLPLIVLFFPTPTRGTGC